MYYRGAQAAVVVYDITNVETYARAKSWIKELQRQANPNIIIALVGNKLDLCGGNGEESSGGSGKRQVELAEASEYANENGLLFVEASAKTGASVNDIFINIAKKLPKEQPKPRTGGNRIDLNQRAAQDSDRPNCC